MCGSGDPGIEVVRDEYSTERKFYAAVPPIIYKISRFFSALVTLDSALHSRIYFVSHHMLWHNWYPRAWDDHISVFCLAGKF
jgi:hypothetical protein